MTAMTAPVSVGTGTNNASSTTVTISVSGVPPRGSLIVAGARFNAAQTSASCSISDGINAWTVRTTSNGNEFIGDAIVVGDMTGATITLTGSTTATAKVAFAVYSQGGNQTARFGSQIGAVPFFQGTARNIGGSTVTPSDTGDLVLGIWSLDTTETSMSAGSGYTIGPTWTGTGYYTANSLSLAMVYQIVTARGAKQPTGTGGVSPTAYGAGAFTYRAAAPRHPAVNHQDPGWMFRGLRANWNRRRSGLLVPDYPLALT